jgi:hypothetical protein
MRDEAAPAVRPWRPLLAGLGTGIGLLAAFVVLSATPIKVGPWSLEGNGALGVIGVGIPLATYVGWTMLAARDSGQVLALRAIAFAIGLAAGMGPLALFFGLPILFLGGALAFALLRRPVPPIVRWTALVLSAAIAAIPTVGLVGLGLLPGSATGLAAGRPQRERTIIGVVLAVALVAVVFVAPVLTSQSTPIGPGQP